MRRLVRILGFVLIAGAVLASNGPSGATPPPRHTTSRYERNAVRAVFARQGAAAGRAAAQGIVILDFGRPAAAGGHGGTLAFGGKFIRWAAIEGAVRAYVTAYFRTAPRYTSLDVAVGTNDSCGTGQPCGGSICGCIEEPTSFGAWGAELAGVVTALDAWSTGYRLAHGFTDDVRIVAADDAEPSFDPRFVNTYDVLAGYAGAVRGSWPAMVDYGSAEPSYWSEAELFEVAYGFAPDVPMPEIYYPIDALEWARLLRYAKSVLGREVSVEGVLCASGKSERPAVAYEDMLAAVAAVTGQQRIPWLSLILR